MTTKNHTTSRRRVLTTIGAGTAGLSLGSIGFVEARPPQESCQPPDDTWLVAKFENVDGSFQFDESGMPLLDPSGSFTFSDVEYKEDDPEEITSFDWESTPYAITDVIVKAGPECFTNSHRPGDLPGGGVTGTFEGSVDIEELGTKKAVSYVAFYAIPYWQVDIANTASPYEIGSPTTFVEGGAGSGDVCIDWLVGPHNLDKAGLTEYSSLSAADDCETVSTSFTIADVPESADGNISVISALAPALLDLGHPSAGAVIAEQQIYDEDARTYGEGDIGDSFVHTVDIPTV